MFDLMPFGRNNKNFLDYFDHIERNFFKDFGSLAQFRTDILDKGDKFVLQAELPGFQKEDIHIDINDEMLIISANHTEEKQEDRNNYIRRERQYGSYSRSFGLENIEQDGITANYQNGVLEVTLPKSAPTQRPEPRKIEIN